MAKGRNAPSIDDQTQAQKFGTDQDPKMKVRRDRTTTGQEVFVVSYNGVEIVVTMRTAIDLVHKLQKQLTDAMIDMMLVFMKS